MDETRDGKSTKKHVRVSKYAEDVHKSQGNLRPDMNNESYGNGSHLAATTGRAKQVDPSDHSSQGKLRPHMYDESRCDGPRLAASTVHSLKLL